MPLEVDSGVVVVVVGVAVVVGARVVVVVVDTTVVVISVVLGTAAVVVGASSAISVPLLHADTASRNVRATEHFLTPSVCHLPPEGGVGVSLAP